MTNYDTSEDGFYKGIENASASQTDEVAYRVIGHLGFHNLNDHVGSLEEVRVCDVGCYTGGTTIRWLYTGKALNKASVVKVLGFDVHEDTILEAHENYPDRPNLFFCKKDPADPIPLVEDQPYHLMFAPFVLETINDFDDVQSLCCQMVNALDERGEIYFLRLHPRALQYADGFRDYSITTRETWTHGDTFQIRLAGQARLIQDRFWQPEQIAEIFSEKECQVELMPISWEASPKVIELLKGFIAATRLDDDMAEWSVPLYQIIRVVKGE
jgi:SAM-dependent methyltransferase